MRTIVYVDGFNLYFRLVAQRPALKRLNVKALAEKLLEISVHMGSFLLSEKFGGLVKPPEFRPRYAMTPPWPDVVKVIKVEEKGSDVNLASHLLLDAFQGNFDVAAVLSNDSDLVDLTAP